jgi:LysM repeat protein
MTKDETYREVEKIINQALQEGETKLDLREMIFTELPESIGQLTDLQFLDLEANGLATLPESIGRLTNLQFLNLDANQLTTLPESIGHLTNLQTLNLFLNQLTTLPESIGQLGRLQNLVLGQNQLTTLPESIGQLTNLQALRLEGNQLTTLPESIGQLTNLQALNLQKNQLTTLPESIGQLSNLQTLDLRTNQLTTLPKSITQLEYLKNLYIEKNPLDSELAASYEQGLEGVMKYLREQHEPQEYIVKSGDTLARVANQFNVTVDEISQMNRISDLDQIQVGKKLIIPDGRDPARTEPDPDAIEHPAKPVEPLAWVETDAIPVIGDLRDYRPSKHDSLDAIKQAKIFATLLIAKDVHPPFALGLLGDWGVGKTFFMRLMQEKITSIAGKKAQTEQSSDSVSRAAQIEFNAWHYVDSDLWASLASHIFDGLSEELCGSKDKVETIRRRLSRKIHSSKQDQKEANIAIDSAQKERQESALALTQSQEKRAQIAAEYDTQRFKRIWEAVLEVKPDTDNEDQKDWPDLDALRKRAEATAKRLGITEAIDSTEEVQRVYASLREILRRSSGLTASFAATFTGKGLWLSIPVLLFLLGLVLAWPWILEQIEMIFKVSEKSITNLLAPLLQLGTIIGAAAAWAGKNLKSISSALGYLEKIRDEIHEPRIKLDKPTDTEAKLKKTIEKFDAQIATEQRRIEEADRQITEAQAEIQRINAGGLVYDFLEDRIHDSRYLDRLGLISVIRRDFEELGSVLRDWGKHDKNTDDKGASSSENTWDPTPIKRIILYIDDLDRCPPKRVVEVLQAVHLILAFDLFVVVLAVDARWLERSLNESYNPQIGARDGTEPQESRHRFSAHNYLEKIFQIPFSLPKMAEAGYRKLVADMIATPRKQAERAAKQEEETSVSGEVTPQGDAGGETIRKTAGGTVSSMVSDPDDNKDEERKRREEQEEARKRIEAMLLRDYEEKFIKALYPFISTPRLVKRFLNIYRLIRASASSQGENFENFINAERGEYRAALILLAIVVGRADVAAEILNDLPFGRRKKFTTWLKNAYTEKDEMESQLNKEPTAYRQKTRKTTSPSEKQSRLEELREAVLEISRDIKEVAKDLDSQGGPPFDDRLATYRKWAPAVGRYSFRWHLNHG